MDCKNCTRSLSLEVCTQCESEDFGMLLIEALFGDEQDDDYCRDIYDEYGPVDPFTIFTDY